MSTISRSFTVIAAFFKMRLFIYHEQLLDNLFSADLASHSHLLRCYVQLIINEVVLGGFLQPHSFRCGIMLLIAVSLNTSFHLEEISGIEPEIIHFSIVSFTIKLYFIRYMKCVFSRFLPFWDKKCDTPLLSFSCLILDHVSRLQ